MAVWKFASDLLKFTYLYRNKQIQHICFLLKRTQVHGFSTRCGFYIYLFVIFPSKLWKILPVWGCFLLLQQNTWGEVIYREQRFPFYSLEASKSKNMAAVSCSRLHVTECQSASQGEDRHTQYRFLFNKKATLAISKLLLHLWKLCPHIS